MQELDQTDVSGPAPRVFSVTELTRAVRTVLEGAIGEVQVEGEIGSYRQQTSGHQYFTLKDERCQIACVLFRRGRSGGLSQIPLEEGMQVRVRGQLTVYEARGQYQIVVSSVQAGGVGLLQARFEALKRKLDAEGLFAPDRKQSLPRFPKVLGIVTSPTGAAIRDMLNILRRRAPWIRILVNPVRVQGDGAATEIAAAVREFNDWKRNGLPKPDAIILARGGGSVEDLWEFNDEKLARAIAESAVPVVSAVGHEIDFTISDFVADLRAPTPSAAAELVAPDAAELLDRISEIRARLGREVSGDLKHRRARLEFVERSMLFHEPGRVLAELAQRLDMANEGLLRGANGWLREKRQRIEALAGKLRQHRPDQLLALRRQHVETGMEVLRQRVCESVRRRKDTLDRLRGLLEVLSPQATLERGYTITTDSNGRLLTTVGQIRLKMRIRTQLRDGQVDSEVV